MTLTRRRLFATFMATAAASCLPGSARAGTAAPARRLPPVLRAADSARSLDAGGPAADLWTYNDSFPGPLLRLRQGETLALSLHNALPQPTSLHWHGVRIENAMDGVAGLTGAALQPGETHDIAFTARDAGTFLYRPLVPEHAAEQTERGLAGVLIVDEEAPAYADDFVLILDDIALDDGGRVRPDFLAAADIGLAGRLGNRLLINGRTTPGALRRPPGHRLRVRIVNIANARPLTIGFENIATHIIAADGQPVDDPFPPSRNRLTLAPFNRVDVVLVAPQAGVTGTIAVQLGDGLPVLELTGEGEPVADAPAGIAALPASLLSDALDLAAARRFDIAIGGGLDPQEPQPRIADPARVWTLGGRAWADAAGRPLFNVPRGTPVVLALENTTPFLQALHLHGHHARQLHRLDDGWEPYWLDTIAIPPAQTVRVAFLADNPGRWMIGSAILDRLGTGLAGWFEVG
ncbi:multicopper oxidase family protein [Pseudochelatococcus sp. B33]